MVRAATEDDAVEAALDIASPCIGACRIDPVHRLCAGCFRTRDEIAAWSRLNEADRRAVLDALSPRRDRAKAGPGSRDRLSSDRVRKRLLL